MLNIEVKTVPYKEIRNNQIDDYWETNRKMFFEVADLDDWRMQACIFIHSFCEFLVAKTKGIREEEITDFDAYFEAGKKAGLHSFTGEAGDHHICPYRKQHRFAENIERLLCHELGVEWSAYEKAIEELE